MKSAATAITGVQMPAWGWGVTLMRSLLFQVFQEPRVSLALPSSTRFLCVSIYPWTVISGHPKL